MYIHENLKSLRLESGFTQQQLANRLGIGQTTIACYENGTREPHIESLIAYADLFDCTLDYLVGRTESADTPIRPGANSLILTQEEISLIKQYRELDKHSQAKLEGYLACLIKK